MPELPEVENLRQGLERVIVGQKILKVEIRKPKLVSGSGTLRTASKSKVREFEQGIAGERFTAVERRAKNLLFRLSHGKLIIVHLKMSGQFVYKAKGSKKLVEGGHPIELSETELPNKHTHVIFTLSGGTLFYNDTRMFGYLLYYPNKQTFEAKNHFTHYGAEPLLKEFTYKYFSEALKRKNGKIKAVLMNQDIVTGVGNIYADESLFESRIHPTRPASSLTAQETKKLHSALIRILKKATKVGGSSVATYRLLDDTRGNYAREHKVYGKAGKPCPNCGKPLSRTLIQTRTTIYCSKCQK